MEPTLIQSLLIFPATWRWLAIFRAFAVSCVVIILGCPVSALADVNSVELEALRKEIKALESQLAKDNKSRDSAADTLEKIEKRVVDVRKRVKNTQTEQAQTESDIATLELEKEQLRASLQSQREHISNLLRNIYTTGERPHIRMLLSEESPARATRALVWYGYVADARKELMASIDSDIQRSREINAKLEQRATELAESEASLLRNESELSFSMGEKRDLLASLDKRLDRDSQRADELKDNEQRLVKLIETIEAARRKERLRQQQLAEEAAKKRAEKAAREREQLAEAKKEKAEARQRELELELERQQEEAERLAKQNERPSFEQLKGKLSLPLEAEIIGLFGEQKPESGVRWEGLMLAGSVGEAVHAVAAGEVVYADWYRGYGQLLLIDHGDDYISLYSHNSEIVKKQGEFVSAGEIVALVGTTGGLTEPGLYFEIRQASRPRDPLIWCKR